MPEISGVLRNMLIICILDTLFCGFIIQFCSGVLAYWDDNCRTEKVGMSATFGEHHFHLCWSNSIISPKVLDELGRIEQLKSGSNHVLLLLFAKA